MTIDHLSYSTLSSFMSCPRKVYLEKVKKAEPVPAWFFVIGTAVHQYIERSLLGDESLEVDEYFHAEVTRLRSAEPDTSLWLHGGSREEPLVEALALRRAQECAQAAVDFLKDFEAWEVELDVSGFLPGCDLPIRAIIDLTGRHKKYGPVIVDWKTGSSKPKDNLQLETYNALLTQGSPHGYMGLWVMLKPGASKARPVEFKETPESLGTKYAEVARRIEANAWPAVPQFNCNFCTMKPNCKLMSGVTPRTKYYDQVVEDGGVPF